MLISGRNAFIDLELFRRYVCLKKARGNCMDNLNNISLIQIEIFLRVADCGNVAEAAKKLFISQSAATRWIQKLEAITNVKLFVRTNRGVYLTKEGERLYSQIKNPYTKLNSVLFSLRQVDGSDGNVVRLACFDINELFDLLGPLITQYENLYPGNRIDVQMCDHNTIREGMLSGRFDCAFTYITSIKGLVNMEFRKYRQLDTFFALSSRSAAILDDKLDFEKLSGSHLYIRPSDKPDMAGIRDLKICAENGFSPLGIQYVSSELTVAALVRDTSGFAVVGPSFNAGYGADIRLFPVKVPVGEEQFAGIVWKPEEANQETRKFVESVSYIDAFMTDTVMEG